jgi:FkbM family methyltransferase
MIIFDVGANNGKSCVDFSDDPNNTVYAFEPTPDLIENHLRPRAKSNYIIIPKAVGDFNGEAEFNLAVDPGCNSLNTFVDNVKEIWPDRNDLFAVGKLKVEVIRMDTFIEEYNIQKVDILHCDTQGNDLKVLKSFGKYINIIERGEVEAFDRNKLYRDMDNSKDKIIEFLESNNFKIDDITVNDPHSNEINIIFSKK